MRFIADEGVDKKIVDELRKAGEDVWYVAEQAPATEDDALLEKAQQDGRIIITRDKDFGELVYRLNKIHSGVVLLRLEEYDTIQRSEIVLKLIREHGHRLMNSFTVIQKGMIRIR